MSGRTAVTRLAVTLSMDGDDVPVGTLAWSRDRWAAAFEYAAGFAERELPISPFHLKAGPGVRIAPATPFRGLFGVFADSLPDGWGRLLLDRRIAALGGDPDSLTPIERLAFVGTRGMGALTYRPERTVETPDEAGFDVDRLAAASAAILAGAADDAGTNRDVEVLLGANGGSAGARPKVLVLRDAATGEFSLDTGGTDGTDRQAWLVKFGTSADPVDMGRIEHAVALTAKEAGISMPETMTVVGGSGNAHFAVRRFDRDRGRRIHVHTLAGLLDADFRTPSLTYEGYLKATRILTRDAGAVEEAFRRAVFNVMIANRGRPLQEPRVHDGRGGRVAADPCLRRHAVRRPRRPAQHDGLRRGKPAGAHGPDGPGAERVHQTGRGGRHHREGRGRGRGLRGAGRASRIERCGDRRIDAPLRGDARPLPQDTRGASRTETTTCPRPARGRRTAAGELSPTGSTARGGRRRTTATPTATTSPAALKHRENRPSDHLRPDAPRCRPTRPDRSRPAAGPAPPAPARPTRTRPGRRQARRDVLRG